MARAFTGIWFPAKLWLRRDLSMNEKAVMLEVNSLDLGPDRCFANNRHFADHIGVSVSRASEIISSLVERKFLGCRLHWEGKRVVKRNLWLMGSLERVNDKPSDDEEPLRITEGPLRNIEAPPSENTEDKNTPLNNTPKNPPTPASGGVRVRKKAERKFDYSPEFEAFWEAYPNKRGSKADAWKEFPAAVESIMGADMLMVNLQAYEFDTRDDFKFVPHAARWLARRAWDDDYDAQSKRVWAILMAREARKPAAPVPSPLEGIPM